MKIHHRLSANQPRPVKVKKAAIQAGIRFQYLPYVTPLVAFIKPAELPMRP